MTGFEVAEQWDEIVGGETKRLERMTWRGEEEGESVVGTFKELKTVETSRGEAQVLTILTEENEVSIWPNKMLQRLLEKVELAEGMKIKVVFTGMKTSQNGYDYRTYKLFVKRE